MLFLLHFLLEEFTKTHTYTHTGQEKWAQKARFPKSRRKQDLSFFGRTMKIIWAEFLDMGKFAEWLSL